MIITAETFSLSHSPLLLSSLAALFSLRAFVQFYGVAAAVSSTNVYYTYLYAIHYYEAHCYATLATTLVAKQALIPQGSYSVWIGLDGEVLMQ